MFRNIHNAIYNYKTWCSATFSMAILGMLDSGNKLINGQDQEPNIIEKLSLTNQYIVLGLMAYYGVTVSLPHIKNYCAKFSVFSGNEVAHLTNETVAEDNAQIGLVPTTPKLD